MSTLLLWSAPLLILLVGGTVLVMRSRQSARSAPALTPEEEARLQRILDKQG